MKTSNPSNIYMKKSNSSNTYMNTSEINIRDPYILKHEGQYYLYGTRSATCWGLADGFDAYVSEDMENWLGPIEIFHNDGSFWADRNYWAPECHFYKGAFYLFASFKSVDKHLGTQILKATAPTGPFLSHSDGPITPSDWECLDGTFYVDQKGTPYMIFSRSFIQEKEGGMYALELSADLKSPVSSPKTLFQSVQANWAKPVPFAKQEFDMDGDVYFSDGPFLYRTQTGELLMLWSSWGTCGYAMGIAHSDNGEIDGNWTQEETALFAENGGHGMIFTTIEDVLTLVLHYPNDKLAEKPCFCELEEVAGTVKLK